MAKQAGSLCQLETQMLCFLITQLGNLSGATVPGGTRREAEEKGRCSLCWCAPQTAAAAKSAQEGLAARSSTQVSQLSEKGLPCAFVEGEKS